MYIDEPTAVTLETALATEYRKELSRRAKRALVDLSPHVAQAQLERLGDVAQGYLSRIYNGHGTPSPRLVLLLALLAQDTTLLEWVARYWTEPSPVSASSATHSAGRVHVRSDR